MPADAILGEADRFGADLIMVGAHRQSPLTSHAPGLRIESHRRAGRLCGPRRAIRHRRARARGDGRLHAGQARHDDRRHIADVRELHGPRRGGRSAPPRYAGVVLSEDERSEAYRATIAAATDDAALAVEEAVTALAAQGRRVESELRLGDAAGQLVAAARDWPADMVVLGSGTTSTVKRLLLGSAARRVLDDVSSSVLIARERKTQGESRPEQMS